MKWINIVRYLTGQTGSVLRQAVYWYFMLVNNGQLLSNSTDPCDHEEWKLIIWNCVLKVLGILNALSSQTGLCSTKTPYGFGSTDPAQGMLLCDKFLNQTYLNP